MMVDVINIDRAHLGRVMIQVISDNSYADVLLEQKSFILSQVLL